VIVPRPSSTAQEHVDFDPVELDVCFAASERSLPRLLAAYEAELGLCTGFSWRLGRETIGIPRFGIVNGHPSLLPRYRGPYPVAWAVRNGESDIGMSYHFMDEGFDTGNLLAQIPIPLDPEETWETLTPKLAAATAELLPVVFRRLADGDGGEPQHGGEYQGRFEPEYERVDTTRTAAEVHTQVRAWAFVPPRARTGPLLERRDDTVRLVRTSLEEVAGAERLECSDGPLWVIESVPA
jgi:methionyl-tRNA formyltransferase